jgi:hypothetical protein
MLEKCHAVGGLIVLGCGIASQVHKVSGIYDGVPKAEDTLIAAAQPYMGIE